MKRILFFAILFFPLLAFSQTRQDSVGVKTISSLTELTANIDTSYEVIFHDPSTGKISYRASVGEFLKTINALPSVIGTSQITNATIINEDISGSAAIALSKLQNLTANRLVGRDTTGTGIPESLTVGYGFQMGTDRIDIDTVSATGLVSKSRLTNALDDISGGGGIDSVAVVDTFTVRKIEELSDGSNQGVMRSYYTVGANTVKGEVFAHQDSSGIVSQCDNCDNSLVSAVAQEKLLTLKSQSSSDTSYLKVRPDSVNIYSTDWIYSDTTGLAVTPSGKIIPFNTGSSGSGTGTAYALTRDTSTTGPLTLDFQNRSGGYFQVFMGSVTRDSILFSNPPTSTVGEYKLHFRSVNTDTVYFPSSAYAYDGVLLGRRQLTNDTIVSCYYDHLSSVYFCDEVGTSIAETYLLDTYSGGSHAYSLRQLSSSFTGDVIRVERSGDNAESGFTPAEITDGTLTTWVNAGGGTQNGHVIILYDQIDTFNVYQPDITKAGLIVSSGTLVTVNSKPAIDFDGTDDYMSNPGNWTYTSGLSFYGVAKVDVVDGGDKLWADDVSGVAGYFLQFAGAQAVVQVNDNSTGFKLDSIPTLTTAQTLIAWNFNGSTGAINKGLNGSSSSKTMTWTGPINTGSSVNIGLFGAGDGTAVANGKFQELVLWPSTQTANKSGIETDINNHYSIY